MQSITQPQPTGRHAMTIHEMLHDERMEQEPRNPYTRSNPTQYQSPAFAAAPSNQMTTQPYTAMKRPLPKFTQLLYRNQSDESNLKRETQSSQTVSEVEEPERFLPCRRVLSNDNSLKWNYREPVQEEMNQMSPVNDSPSTPHPEAPVRAAVQEEEVEDKSPWPSAQEYVHLFQQLSSGQIPIYDLGCDPRGVPMHPEFIYNKPVSCMYFLRCKRLLGKGSFGFPRKSKTSGSTYDPTTGFHKNRSSKKGSKKKQEGKEFEWRKMSFVTGLPKKQPLVRYITATCYNRNGPDQKKKVFRMHAVMQASPDGSSEVGEYVLVHIRAGGSKRVGLRGPPSMSESASRKSVNSMESSQPVETSMPSYPGVQENELMISPTNSNPSVLASNYEIRPVHKISEAFPQTPPLEPISSPSSDSESYGGFHCIPSLKRGYHTPPAHSSSIPSLLEKPLFSSSFSSSHGRRPRNLTIRLTSPRREQVSSTAPADASPPRQYKKLTLRNLFRGDAPKEVPNISPSELIKIPHLIDQSNNLSLNEDGKCDGKADRRAQDDTAVNDHGISGARQMLRSIIMKSCHSTTEVASYVRGIQEELESLKKDRMFPM